ncbi:MAG: CotH kinase family protein [Candidatus Krumholzibacteria bacterium]|nr:CotH kinase family protein [Candidatus Krumholzibacteria bacterium]
MKALLRYLEFPAVLVLAMSLAGPAFGQNLVINEFMADNGTTMADQNGEFDDWIELYNNSGVAIALGGYFLSDNTNLTKWVFPDTTIGPGGYLIVWADDDEGQSGLHAGFKLSASGESIYLTDLDTVVVDQVVFGVQTTDLSTGRYPNGTGDFILMNPTFGGPNDGSTPGGDDDPSLLIFDDTKVHNFYLHFYISDWADTLKYNKENGERYMPAQLTCDAIVLDSIGVRYKGNSSYTLSANTPKKPFKFNFDKYVDGQTFFGLDELNLSNCVKDPSFMRETIAYRIARHYLPAPRTGYANLYVDGELIGFYILVEEVDKKFLDRHFSNNGFNLYKASDDGATLKYRGEDKSEYKGELELKTNEDADDWSGLIEMIDELNNASAEDFASTMQDYLNLDSCIRNLALTMVLSHFDSYTGSGRNFYLYDAQDSAKFSMIPWDVNESFGVYSNNWDAITQDVIDISNLEDRPLNRRILENDSLRSVYLGFIADMIGGPASYDSVAAAADAIKPLIDGYVQADVNKFYGYQDFVDNVESDVYIDMAQLVPGVKSFSQERNANLATQLLRDPVYPGDTDNNGVVNALDILPIGVYFLQRGNERSSVSFAWGARYVLPWDVPAETYADSNGDGVVDEKDVIGLGVNWGNTHGGVTTSFEIDPGDTDLVEEHKADFRAIYNSLNGSGEAVEAIRSQLESILDIESTLPAAFELSQNYPNPFNPSTTIRFALVGDQRVTLTIYNVAGRVVSVPLKNRMYKAGWHTFEYDAGRLTTGVYVYRISTDGWSETRKMVVVK